MRSVLEADVPSAGAGGLATGLTALSTGVAGWVPVTFDVIGGVLTVGLLIDLVRQC
jgi:ubiquinone biosynthesis protein